MTVALNWSQAAEEVAKSFGCLSALDAQELNLQALEIMAEWREDLTKSRLRRALAFKLELIGGAADDAARSF